MADLHDYGTGKAPPQPRSCPADHRLKIEPTTFDDLLKRAGPYSDATKAHVEWGAVTSWLMKNDAVNSLARAFISGEAASLSVFLTRGAIEHEVGWPGLSELPASVGLYGLPHDAQCIARRLGADVHTLWEAAGRPHLNAKAFTMAYRYLVACVRKGTIPPVLTIGDVPPN